VLEEKFDRSKLSELQYWRRAAWKKAWKL
jgi:hypothetical protein